jgi:hypothetical protein
MNIPTVSHVADHGTDAEINLIYIILLSRKTLFMNDLYALSISAKSPDET